MASEEQRQRGPGFLTTCGEAKKVVQKKARNFGEHLLGLFLEDAQGSERILNEWVVFSAKSVYSDPAAPGGGSTTL